MQIILDKAKLCAPASAHAHLMEKMAFPDYYGRNLDALYDMLTDLCEETEIVILSEEEGIGSDYLTRLISVIEEATEVNAYLSLIVTD